MPDMDGLEATAIIRAARTQAGGYTPIVALTAHTMKGDRERCMAAGMDQLHQQADRRGDVSRNCRVDGRGSPRRVIQDGYYDLALVMAALRACISRVRCGTTPIILSININWPR